MPANPEKICVWPTYEWCYSEALECYQRACGLSDDYMEVEVPEAVAEGGEEAIDRWVEEEKVQG